ncbi:XrtA system polysaccharide chain length determinant [Sulfuriferula sp.]|uniref:XrtA system polysaccharide chain length determinant n=1 Tax=Sulfuriferula sp. TaxID=2025307 RepID=UPI00272F0E9A|nr:XrtA system polysaccharide chain length determinant [Sulfuriferula sp.]MDP2025319.1 GNVR domain-containing protein [Sulfuriferula sp.]
MDELLNQLMGYARATWHRRWYIIIVAWVVSIAGWVWVYTLPSRFEASARVYVDTQTLLKPLLTGLTVEPNVDQQIKLMTRTLVSRPNLEKVARMTDMDIKAKSPQQTEAMLDGLASQIKLEASNTGTNLYTIAYQNQHPEVAKRVVQALLTIFVESSLGKTRKDLVSSQKFIDDQLKVNEQKLTETESAIKDFKLKHMGLMPGQGGDYFSKLSETATALRQAQLDLREATSRRDQLKRQLSDEEPEIAAGAAVSQVNPELDARIQALQKNLDVLRLTYTELHPDIVSTKRLIKQLEDQKLQEAKTAKTTGGGRSQNPVYQQLTIAIAEADATAASLASRVNDFQARYNALKSTVDSTPEIEAEYTQLTRDYEVYKQNYADMLQRRETANLSGEVESKTDVVDFRVIDPPRVPLQPSWPNRPLLISLAPLVGILAGIAVAFLVSQLRRTVTDRRVLRELTGLPLLGSVTRIETDAVKIKKRKGMIAYGLSILSLIGAYGILLGLQMFMAR